MRRNLGIACCRSKDRLSLPSVECDHTFLRWQQYSQRKFAYDSRVNSRSQSTPRERYRTGLSREQMSLWFAGYPKTPGCDVRFESEADPTAPKSDFRLTPGNRLKSDITAYPFRAISGSGYFYSITSSARPSSAGGISRPSAFAVVRLMTRSNFVGCSTGISAGFAPRRILST
jgi:hypothetical protein